MLPTKLCSLVISKLRISVGCAWILSFFLTTNVKSETTDGNANREIDNSNIPYQPKEANRVCMRSRKRCRRTKVRWTLLSLGYGRTIR